MFYVNTIEKAQSNSNSSAPKAFVFLNVIPVTSNAKNVAFYHSNNPISAETSFSGFKIINNYIENTISEKTNWVGYEIVTENKITNILSGF